MGLLWKKIDDGIDNPPRFLDLQTDICFFAREYISEGYGASDANNLISNFKKDLTKTKNPIVKKYKKDAVNKFASEISSFFPSDKTCFISTIPTSKTKDDSSYDSRMEDMITVLRQKARSKLIVEEPIVLEKSADSVSRGGGVRDPGHIMKHFKWKGFSSQKIPEHLVVIDDVITSGAHFIAYKNFVQENCSDVKIFGVFWARTISDRSF